MELINWLRQPRGYFIVKEEYVIGFPYKKYSFVSFHLAQQQYINLVAEDTIRDFVYPRSPLGLTDNPSKKSEQLVDAFLIDPSRKGTMTPKDFKSLQDKFNDVVQDIPDFQTLEQLPYKLYTHNGYISIQYKEFDHKIEEPIITILNEWDLFQ